MLCLNCNSVIKNKNKYCSNQCQLKYQYKTYINDWKNGRKSRNKYYMGGSINE